MEPYFRVEIAEKEPVGFLVTRWETGYWRKLREDLNSTIGQGFELPQGIREVAGRFGNVEHRMLDFRGVNLSGMELGDIDLAYCCFDHADLSHCKFNRTSFQYSTFNNSTFEKSQWELVQAAPIMAENANFSFATITSSALMGSDLINAQLNTLTLQDVHMEGCYIDREEYSWYQKGHRISHAPSLIVVGSETPEVLEIGLPPRGSMGRKDVGNRERVLRTRLQKHLQDYLRDYGELFKGFVVGESPNIKPIYQRKLIQNQINPSVGVIVEISGTEVGLMVREEVIIRPSPKGQQGASAKFHFATASAQHHVRIGDFVEVIETNLSPTNNLGLRKKSSKKDSIAIEKAIIGKVLQKA